MKKQTCGCEVRGCDASGESAYIVFCPLHKAAPMLLREALGAINDELRAAGYDVKQHPILRRHKKTAEKIERLLKSCECKV